MEISEAQREVRQVNARGFPGLLLSSAVWFVQLLFALTLLAAIRDENRRAEKAG